MARIRAVGFDLDDTLLTLDASFIPQYLRMLEGFVSPILGYQGALAQEVMASTAVMMAQVGRSRRIEDIFYEDFGQRTGFDRQRLEPLFRQFYQDHFPRLQHLARPVYGVMGLLTTIASLGYQVALLTSPVFPEVAISERLRWAGLEGFPFVWRSGLEHVRASKPTPDFYLEAADAVGIPPEEWLMVGNDFAEDILPSRVAGMSAWWIPGEGDRREVPPGVLTGSLYQVLPHLQREAQRSP